MKCCGIEFAQLSGGIAEHEERQMRIGLELRSLLKEGQCGSDSVLLALPQAFVDQFAHRRHGRGSTIIVKLGIPAGAAPLARRIENGPYRHRGRRATRILSGIGALRPHLFAPEVANRAVATLEYVKGRTLFAFGTQRVVVAAEFAADIAIEFQALPAAFLLEGNQLPDR